MTDSGSRALDAIDGSIDTSATIVVNDPDGITIAGLTPEQILLLGQLHVLLLKGAEQFQGTNLDARVEFYKAENGLYARAIDVIINENRIRIMPHFFPDPIEDLTALLTELKPDPKP